MLNVRGSNGYYWSSRTSNAIDVYDLTFYSTYIAPQHTLSKGYGLALRCVAG